MLEDEMDKRGEERNEPCDGEISCSAQAEKFIFLLKNGPITDIENYSLVLEEYSHNYESGTHVYHNNVDDTMLLVYSRDNAHCEHHLLPGRFEDIHGRAKRILNKLLPPTQNTLKSHYDYLHKTKNALPTGAKREKSTQKTSAPKKGGFQRRHQHKPLHRRPTDPLSEQ